MVNAWSLAGSILNGTFDKDYPMKDTKNTTQESDDNEMVEKAYNDYYFSTGINTATDAAGNEVECDGLDYETDYYQDYMADIDEQRAHHFSIYDDGFTLQVTEDKPMAHYFKYHEEEILKDIEEYVSRTYQGHYTGTKHEFRKVQTIDLMAARDIATGFCQANILKYGSRYGSKNGRNKTDLLKVVHYAMLLLHFDGHYGEPSMPSGNFDQMP